MSLTPKGTAERPTQNRVPWPIYVYAHRDWPVRSNQGEDCSRGVPMAALIGAGTPIGRSSETVALERAIDDVAAGEKRAIVLRGAPGTGKTTLLYWARDLATHSGYVCGLVRTPAVGGLPPRFPLSEVLSTLSQGCRAQGVDSPHLLFETAESFGGDSARGIPAPDLLQITRALEEAAAVAPVGIMLDDLQWTPPEEASFLLSVLRLMKARILFVTTTRFERVDDSAVTLESTGDLPVDILELEGLNLDSTSELASRVLAAPVLPSLSQAVYQRTLGNPLFVMETLRSWRGSGEVGVVAGGYWGFVKGVQDDSRSLLQVITGRLAKIGFKGRMIAEVLALMSRGVTLDELRRITQFPEEGVVEELAGLEDQGVVSHDLSTGHRIAHPLFQSSLVAQMNRTRETALHGRIQAALRESIPPRAPSELAYHAVRALEPPADLFQLLDAAADEAQRAGSYAEAAEWYKRLAEAAPDDGSLQRALAGRAAALEHFDAPEAARVYKRAVSLARSSTEKAQLLVGCARARRMAGSLEEALVELRRASELASPPELLEVRHVVAVVHAAQGRVDAAFDMFRSLADETVGTPFHAKTLGHMAVVSYVRGRPDEAVSLSREAMAECSDPSYLDFLHLNLGWFLAVLGEWDEAERLMDGLIRRATQAHDLWLLAMTLSNAAQLCALRGGGERALDLGTQALRLAAHGNPIDEMTARGALGMALLEEGNPSEAMKVVSDIPRLVEIAPERSEVQFPMLVLGETLLAVGDTSEVQRTLDSLRVLVEFNLTHKVSLDRLTAQLELERGAHDSALEITERYVRNPSLFALEQARILEVSAHALARSGERDACLARASEALVMYQRLGAERRAVRLQQWIDERTPRRKGRPRSVSPGDMTHRERQIIRLIATGLTNAEIARELVISPRTVKKHIENVKAKLGVQRRTQLAAMDLHVDAE